MRSLSKQAFSNIAHVIVVVSFYFANFEHLIAYRNSCVSCFVPKKLITRSLELLYLLRLTDVSAPSLYKESTNPEIVHIV